eukprot:gene6836-8479_t
MNRFETDPEPLGSSNKRPISIDSDSEDSDTNNTSHPLTLIQNLSYSNGMVSLDEDNAGDSTSLTLNIPGVSTISNTDIAIIKRQLKDVQQTKVYNTSWKTRDRDRYNNNNNRFNNSNSLNINDEVINLDEWDLSAIISFFTKNQNPISNHINADIQVRNWLNEILRSRNDWAHQHSVPLDVDEDISGRHNKMTIDNENNDPNSLYPQNHFQKKRKMEPETPQIQTTSAWQNPLPLRSIIKQQEQQQKQQQISNPFQNQNQNQQPTNNGFDFSNPTFVKTSTPVLFSGTSESTKNNNNNNHNNNKNNNRNNNNFNHNYNNRNTKKHRGYLPNYSQTNDNSRKLTLGDFFPPLPSRKAEIAEHNQL